MLCHFVSAPSIVVCLLLISMVGCGAPYRVAEVDGKLLVHGQPAGKVRVQFVPDVDKQSQGPASSAETDAAGKFTLRLLEEDATIPRIGAVVGWHRVVLSDLQLAESATGRGLPIRFGPEYTLPGSTPLREEVKDVRQTIEIKLP